MLYPALEITGTGFKLAGLRMQLAAAAAARGGRITHGVFLLFRGGKQACAVEMSLSFVMAVAITNE